MNEWKITTRKLGMRYAAIVRRVDKAEAYALRERGEVALFDTEKDAELAGCRHILHLLNTEPRFEMAPRVPEAVALEEKTFGEVTSRKGKRTKVQRNRRRRMQKRAA